MNDSFRKNYRTESIALFALGAALVYAGSGVGLEAETGAVAAKWLGYLLLFVSFLLIALSPTLELEFDAGARLVRVKNKSRLKSDVREIPYSEIKSVQSYEQVDDQKTYQLSFELTNGDSINLNLSYWSEARAASVGGRFAQQVGCGFTQK